MFSLAAQRMLFYGEKLSKDRPRQRRQPEGDDSFIRDLRKYRQNRRRTARGVMVVLCCFFVAILWAFAKVSPEAYPLWLLELIKFIGFPRSRY